MTLIINTGTTFTGSKLPPRAVRDPVIADGTALLLDFSVPFCAPQDAGDLPDGSEFQNLADGAVGATSAVQSSPARIQKLPGGGLLWPGGSGGASVADYLDMGTLAGFDFDGNWAAFMWVEFPSARSGAGYTYDRLIGLGADASSNANASTFSMSTSNDDLTPDGTLLPDESGAGTSYGSTIYGDVAYDTPVLWGMGVNAGTLIQQVRNETVKSGTSTPAAAFERDPAWRLTAAFPHGGIIYRILLDDLDASGRKFEELAAAEFERRNGAFG